MPILNENATESQRARTTKDFFISYTHADEAWAEWIAWQLEAIGYSTAFQKWDFGRGNVLINIADGLSAKKTILVWSTAYGKSKYTEHEWTNAVAQDPSGTKDSLIILRIDKSDVSVSLKALVYTDLFDPHDEDVAKQKLITRIQGGRAKPAAEPVFPGREKPPYPGDANSAGSNGRIEAGNPEASPATIIPHTAPLLDARSNQIQVIGWKGIEANNLYSRLENISIAFLTTEMSLETLPDLEYYAHGFKNKLNFNVVYMDYEFAERYRRLGLISDLSRIAYISTFFSLAGKVAPAIRNLMFPDGNFPDGGRTGIVPIYCAPVQFGFNEILLNPKGELSLDLKRKASDPSTAWSHGDFDLTTLLEDNVTKVAIWHWYLPSLLQFLLSAENTDISSLNRRLSERKSAINVTRTLANYVKKVRHLLEDKNNGERRQRIKVFASMEGIRAALGPAFKAGVVLGVGSSALGNAGTFDHIKPIVPKQGVFAWINGAAALKHHLETAGTLIDNWLNIDTQVTMASHVTGYFGLPVHEQALLQIQQSFPKVHAVQTFEKVLSDDKQSFREGMVAPRVLPRQIWGQWVHLWEEEFLGAFQR